GTLDEGIGKATGIYTIEKDEKDAVEWLTASPFDRSEGLRPKTIFVDGSEALLHEVGVLTKKGYVVKPLAEHNEEIVDVIVTERDVTDHLVDDWKLYRSEERRVGKECRCRRWQDQQNKNRR